MPGTAAQAPLRGRDPFATRRPAECACAAHFLYKKLGPHGRPVDEGGQEGRPSPPARTKPASRLGSRPPSGNAAAGCCRTASAAWRSARGDSRHPLLLHRAGDAQGELTPYPRPDKRKPPPGGQPAGASRRFPLRFGAGFFMLHSGRHDLTVSGCAVCMPYQPLCSGVACPRFLLPAYPAPSRCPVTARAVDDRKGTVNEAISPRRLDVRHLRRGPLRANGAGPSLAAPGSLSAAGRQSASRDPEGAPARSWRARPRECDSIQLPPEPCAAVKVRGGLGAGRRPMAIHGTGMPAKHTGEGAVVSS
jgi:hypothetical protein